MNWAGVIGSTAVVVGVLSALATHWSMSARLRQRERRLVGAAQEQMAQGTAQLRASITKLQLELEKERVSSRQRVAAGVADQRAQVVRLQGQLKLAYAQLDQLREEAGGAKAAWMASPAADTNGFAATRPFVDTAH